MNALGSAFHWTLTAPPWLLVAGLGAVAVGSVALRRWAKA